MTELDIAVDVLHDWLQKNGKCTGVDDDEWTDEEFDDIFFNNTKNNGRLNNDRILDEEEDLTQSPSNRCPTLGRMVGGGGNSRQCSSAEEVLKFNPELVSRKRLGR